LSKLIFILLLLFTSLSAFDINQASADDFMEVKGVGVKTAERIIEYRNSGNLNSIDDLINVKGIGKKKLANIKEYFDGESSDSEEDSVIDLTKYD